MRTSPRTWSTEPVAAESRIASCPSCGGRVFLPVWDFGVFSVSRCRSCGLLQQQPQPVRASVIARYDDGYLAYQRENEEAFLELAWKSLRDAGFESFERSAFRRAAAENRAPRLLDAGCSTGALLELMRGRGWNVSGVEVCPGSVRAAKGERGLDVRLGAIEESGFPESEFDAVCASHLVEHLNDPAGFFRVVRALLRPGAACFIATPNADGFQAKLLADRWRSAIPDHLYLFSGKTLQSTMARAGLKVERVVTWGGWARGLEPSFIKRPLDVLAKLLNVGDVMMVRAVKENP